MTIANLSKPVGTTEAVALPHVIAPEIADAFYRMLWRDLQDQKFVMKSHKRNLVRKNAMEIHGQYYPPMQALHWGLTPVIAQRIGADILPSFVYFRLYFQGDICRVHSDRPACEHSLSVTIANSDGLPWALSVGTRPATDSKLVTDDFGDEPYESYPMGPGDGVLYRGSIRRHGRVTPNPNRWSAHLFMQWVNRGGAHMSEAFERLG